MNRIILVIFSFVIGMIIFGIISEIEVKESYNAGYEQAQKDMLIGNEKLKEVNNYTANKLYLLNYSNYSELGRIKYYPTNYSETAYIKSTPEKNSKFIYFECGNNSTLKILDNKIYCERGNQ